MSVQRQIVTGAGFLLDVVRVVGGRGRFPAMSGAAAHDRVRRCRHRKTVPLDVVVAGRARPNVLGLDGLVLGELHPLSHHVWPLSSLVQRS